MFSTSHTSATGAEFSINATRNFTHYSQFDPVLGGFGGWLSRHGGRSDIMIKEVRSLSISIWCTTVNGGRPAVASTGQIPELSLWRTLGLDLWACELQLAVVVRSESLNEAHRETVMSSVRWLMAQTPAATVTWWKNGGRECLWDFFWNSAQVKSALLELHYNEDLVRMCVCFVNRSASATGKNRGKT